MQQITIKQVPDQIAQGIKYLAREAGMTQEQYLNKLLSDTIIRRKLGQN